MLSFVLTFPENQIGPTRQSSLESDINWSQPDLASGRTKNTELDEPRIELASPNNKKVSFIYNQGKPVGGRLLQLSIVGFSFAGTCFSAISLTRADRSGRNSGTRGFSMWPSFS